jgi:hypothetical protein
MSAYAQCRAPVHAHRAYFDSIRDEGQLRLVRKIAGSLGAPAIHDVRRRARIVFLRFGYARGTGTGTPFFTSLNRNQ